MIEYAITAGEGTLLAYGVAERADVFDGAIDVHLALSHEYFEQFPDATIIARPCSDDCETGK